MASLGTLAVVASSALSAPRRQPPAIHPRSGKPFRPTLGDWEGTVRGFPASFGLVLFDRAGAPRYGLNEVVALRPVQCPTSPDRYSEALIQSARGAPLGAAGSLGLTELGFRGAFTAAKAATMSARFRTGSCSGTLSWHMHPAQRTPVLDGVWRLRFADGQSGSFRVRGGGRLATAIELPSALARCNGAVGAVDLFIGPSGLAQVSQRSARVSIRFGRRTATGKINAGGQGCPGGPFRLAAALQ